MNRPKPKEINWDIGEHVQTKSYVLGRQVGYNLACEEWEEYLANNSETSHPGRSPIISAPIQEEDKKVLEAEDANLEDILATQALIGILSDPERVLEDPACTVRYAYEYADAMIAEKKKREAKK